MKLHAGFDIGGTNARLSLFDEAWSTVASERRGIRDQHRPEDIADTVAQMLREALDGLDVPDGEAELGAVGLGLAGQLDKTGETVLNAPNLGWRDVGFAGMVRQRLAGLAPDRVLVANDLSAIVWGEFVAGAVADVDDVLGVYVGTGIGGAIVTAGALMAGSGGKAGEIGHSKVEPGGRLCGCGQRGCVEAYAGGIHLEEQVGRVAESAGLDEVFREGEELDVDLSAADELAADHDDLDAVWERATDYLAIVIANACTLLNPSVLLLGGGVVMNCDDFRQRLLEKIPALVLAAARQDLEIRLPEMGDDAGVLGAARLAGAFADQPGEVS